MGGATWSSAAYTTRSTEYQTQSREELFSRRRVREDFDPKGISLRESRDSEQNPESTPIIVGLDVTGSMGFIAEHIAKNSLGKLVEGILEKRPISDPHLMMMAIGDAYYDQAPLQVTQFEADIRIAEQLTDLWLEGRGGGNSFESYDLPWIFAANKTSIDSLEKRGKKGYLFTMGDELPPTTPSARSLSSKIGVNLQTDLKVEQALDSAREMYNVFHLIIEEGSFASRQVQRVTSEWKKLLGKKAISVNDYKYISEIIQSIIEINEGASPDDVIDQWEVSACRKAVEYSIYGPNTQ